MKRNIFSISKLFNFYILASALLMTSCTDFFETESNRQIFDPQLDEKTDSMFYMLGIMKGVQQVADQYVLTNEMRGDLVATNAYTEVSLKNLAQFKLDEMKTNKYDSAYLYYRIINNCNYFIAHRKDSALMTGSRYVNIPEIAEAHAVRAWSYLQLVKTYGKVPFYTDPLITIGAASQVRDSVDITNILSKFEADLKHYSGTPVPTYGEVSAGFMNGGTGGSTVEKKIHSSNIMLPVDLVLGDLYLESHEYEKAAQSYFNYIKLTNLSVGNYYVNPRNITYIQDKVPTTMTFSASGSAWSSIFAFSSPKDSVTYIPLASNRLRGVTTDLPRYFGYDFYSTSASDRYFLERQIEASNAYRELSDAQEYYYSQSTMSGIDTVLTAPLGDLRRYVTFQSATKNDSTFNVMIKFNNANIPIYRGATVYLRLAEAINRWGYPDVAFAILKEGINVGLKNRVIKTPETAAASYQYIRPESFRMLIDKIPFITEVITKRSNNKEDTTHTSRYGNAGIHPRGVYHANLQRSPYTLDAIVGKKIAELEAAGSLVRMNNINDTINAVEDLICDEMALELAFEGTRFGDLTRIARHKNNAGWFTANYGSQWLADKLAFKSPAVNLKDERNWYLPFQ